MKGNRRCREEGGRRKVRKEEEGGTAGDGVEGEELLQRIERVQLHLMRRWCY